jgi:hypothetical protein
MSVKKFRIGEKFITNEGYEVEIIDYISSRDCNILIDNKVNINSIRYDQVVLGNVKNPYHPSVCGIGYIGQGEYKPSINGKNTKVYNMFSNMIERCYNEKIQEKYTTYKNCSVDKSWFNFQNFAEWCKSSYVEGWHLDKDILVKGNKIYSPETCCFVPQEINSLFVKNEVNRGDYVIGVSFYKGRYRAFINKKSERLIYLGTFDTPEEAFQAYKTAKEGHIKEVADKWKDLIDPRVYEAMYNYEVETTD